MAQSLITSETQQWLTRNWELHDHWPLILELCIRMRVDPNERLERTQRQGGQHFGSFLKLNHLTLFTWSKRDKEFSHEESQDEQSSSRSLLQSNLLSAFESCSVDQTFSSCPAMSYPADFWVIVLKNRVLKDVFVLIFMRPPRNITGRAQPRLTWNFVADLYIKLLTATVFQTRWHLCIFHLTMILSSRLTDFQHKASKSLWASSLSSASNYTRVFAFQCQHR